MLIPVDTSRIKYTALETSEKLDFQTKEQVIENDVPVWSVTVFAKIIDSDSNGEVQKFSIPSQKKPDFSGNKVDLQDVVAITWSNNGRSGVSFRASCIREFSDELLGDLPLE